MLAAVLAALVLLAAPVDDERVDDADTVYLDNDKTAVGRVVYEDADVVVVRKGSKEQQIPMTSVKEIDSRQRSLNRLLDRLDAFGPGGPPDTTTLLELARFAEHARLPGEARALFLWTLLVEPDNVEANEALGNRQRKGHWSIKHRGKWYRTADLGTLVEQWGDRWELHTAHYDLNTNLPLEQAIGAAIDSERFYRAFMDLFARELSIYEPDEVLVIDAHADRPSYPEPADGRRGYFDESDRVVDALVEGGSWRDDLFHELSHQLVYFTTQRTRQSKGQVPSWLDEGLAEALSTGIGGRLGSTTFDLSSRSKKHFTAHATSDDPYSLDRVLAFSREDYISTQHRNLKYAQSYTLVHFLLYGNEGGYREKFMEYLRSAYKGRSSVTDFKQILDIDPDDFETAWHAYAVQQSA